MALSSWMLTAAVAASTLGQWPEPATLDQTVEADVWTRQQSTAEGDGRRTAPVPVMPTVGLAPAQHEGPFHGAAETLTLREAASAEACGCKAECEKCKAAREKQAALAKAGAGAFKDPFYDNDFRYLNDPAYGGALLGDGLKQLPLVDDVRVDLGGQYRQRYHSERNFRGLGLTGRDDDFLLHRTRLYTNITVGDRFRFFGEYIDAVSEFENFAPRAIEENRSDALNLFVDYMLLEGCSGNLWGRVGRQELLYGTQRLVSPLDWANTRRTFDGAKLFYRGEQWNVDGFWTRPVLVDPKNFDAPDLDQEFYGLWATYKGLENQAVDLYWLGYADYDSPYAAGNNFVFQTCGGRWSASRGPLLAEVEGGYQFGSFGDADHAAGFWTVGGGWKFDKLPWQPTCWCYYDWASGDPTIGNGFNHLFPLGHKYLGFMDLFARSNIEDLNCLIELQPHDKLKLLAWWHLFYLQDGRDVPYNVNMTPFVTTPGGSQYLGQELDLLATWQVAPRLSMLFGYSHFFTGSWYRTNPAAPSDEDADFFYVQSQLNF